MGMKEICSRQNCSICLWYFCRDILTEYSEHVLTLGRLLLRLMSEVLGLHKNHLLDIGYDDGYAMLFNYYPACLQPEIAIGTAKHADADFFTVVLQDNIGGLQILHQNEWIDVPPLPGALVINIGDLLLVRSPESDPPSVLSCFSLCLIFVASQNSFPYAILHK